MKDYFQGRTAAEEDREERRQLFGPSLMGWLLVVALVCVGIAECRAQSTAEASLVVAARELQGLYAGTVMLSAPIGEAHIGLILNRPTEIKLAQLFPDHEPSKHVKDPVHFGGPFMTEALVALVRADGSPGPLSLEVMPGLWFVRHTDAIDRLIETRPNDARYFVGFVVWKPGELEEEIRKGVVVLRPVDLEKLFLPDTTHMHEELAPKKGRIET
jgi:putative AlgH/UPF0301 family transcriptional regulator